VKGVKRVALGVMLSFRWLSRECGDSNVIKFRITIGIIPGIRTTKQIRGFNLISKTDGFRSQITQSNRTGIPIIISFNGHFRDRMMASRGLSWINGIPRN
jgi:hypothetical protein